MRYVTTDRPTKEPVSLASAKEHLKILPSETDDDSYITALIQAARENAEAHMNLPIMTQTRTYYFDRFFTILPLAANLQNFVSVKYVDTNGQIQKLAKNVYVVDTVSLVGTIRLAFSQMWPDIRDECDAVRVTCDCGWESAAEVPQSINQAILLMVGEMFENREISLVGASLQQFPAVKNLLSINSIPTV